MYTLPDLPYGYDQLGKYISGDIMQLHHDKHHQTYVDKLNAALDNAPALRERPLETLLSDLESLPENVRTAIRNHGGGHYNHTLFWHSLSPASADRLRAKQLDHGQHGPEWPFWSDPCSAGCSSILPRGALAQLVERRFRKA